MPEREGASERASERASESKQVRDRRVETDREIERKRERVRFGSLLPQARGKQRRVRWGAAYRSSDMQAYLLKERV